jgi:hypothetical protein
MTFDILVIFKLLSFISALTQGYTSSLQHHKKNQHPSNWAKVLVPAHDAANKEEAKKLQEEIEGDPDNV